MFHFLVVHFSDISLIFVSILISISPKIVIIHKKYLFSFINWKYRFYDVQKRCFTSSGLLSVEECIWNLENKLDNLSCCRLVLIFCAGLKARLTQNFRINVWLSFRLRPPWKLLLQFLLPHTLYFYTTTSYCFSYCCLLFAIFFCRATNCYIIYKTITVTIKFTKSTLLR